MNNTINKTKEPTLTELLNLVKKEIWKNIIGYEGHYQVSNLSRIKILARSIVKYRTDIKKSAIHNMPEKILKTCIAKQDGYVVCNLKREGKSKSFLVHRVIALAFIPNPNNYPQINHKNGIRHDNRLDNLEWCTGKQNSIHAYKVNKRTPPWLGKFGKNHHSSVKVIQKTVGGVFVKEWDSMSSVKRELGIGNLYLCLKKIIGHKTAGGYIWEYKNKQNEANKRTTSVVKS